MSRRNNGEGSKIIQRKDGRWCAAIRAGDGKRLWLYGRTKKEVADKLREAQKAGYEGRLTVGMNQKTGEYLDQWLEGPVRLTVQPTTLDTYRRDVERLRPHIGNVRFDQLRYQHIDRAYAELLKTLSPTSVNRVHRCLKTALRKAVQLGLIAYNPIDRVTAPKAPRKEMRPLTPHEVDVFLQSTRDDRLHALWVLLVTTGMRIGEATGLRWDQIDLDTHVLHVRQTVKRVKGQGLIVGDTKTAHSRRKIQLSSGCVTALRGHQERQDTERDIAGDNWTEKGLIFCTLTGGPLDAGYVGHAKDRALLAAGLPHVRTHDLRHTAASYLLSKGVHPKVVQELLGHSAVTLTLNTYSHVLPVLHKEVADHMDSLYQAD